MASRVAVVPMVVSQSEDDDTVVVVAPAVRVEDDMDGSMSRVNGTPGAGSGSSPVLKWVGVNMGGLSAALGMALGCCCRACGSGGVIAGGWSVCTGRRFRTGERVIAENGKDTTGSVDKRRAGRAD